MDGGGDLVALCDTAGTMVGAGPNGTTLNNTARVVAQWTYDAYGAAQTAEHFYSHAFAHCGHKGLFFDRLDVGVAEGNRPSGLPTGGSPPWGTTVEGGETPRLVPFAHAVYHNRNRMYSPQLGRFLQQDPNATAMTLMAAASHSGRSMGAIAVAFSVEERYGDGANLYQYLGSNPWGNSDALGLSQDPFEMVDDFMAEDMAQRMATMELAGAYWQTVGTIALSAVPVVGSFMAGYEMGQRLAAGSNLQFMDYVTIGAHVLPLVGGIVEEAANIMGRAKSALERLRYQYAMRGARADGALGARYDSYRNLTATGACLLCMAGQTATWTPEGTTRLDHIRLGDLVLTAGDQTSDLSTGELGTYSLVDVMRLWNELGEKPSRAVHLRVTRNDGSTTDIYKLDRCDELEYAGLVTGGAPAFDPTNTLRVWLDDTGETGDRRDDLGPRGGWATVLEIGPEVTLGNGIAFPTEEAAPVMGVFVTTRATLLAMRLSDTKEPLLVTATHPVWCGSRGGWTEAGLIRTGDHIGTASGEVCVESVEIARKGETVYNLSVAGGHTFFVGQDKAWVHNCGGNKVYSTYREAQGLTAGSGGKIQAHHLVEARHLKNWKMSPSEGPAVVLLEDQHYEWSAKLRKQLPYGQKYTEAQVRAGYAKAYSDAPSEWKAAINRHMGW